MTEYLCDRCGCVDFCRMRYLDLIISMGYGEKNPDRIPAVVIERAMSMAKQEKEAVA